MRKSIAGNGADATALATPGIGISNLRGEAIGDAVNARFDGVSQLHWCWKVCHWPKSLPLKIMVICQRDQAIGSTEMPDKVGAGSQKRANRRSPPMQIAPPRARSELSRIAHRFRHYRNRNSP